MLWAFSMVARMELRRASTRMRDFHAERRRQGLRRRDAVPVEIADRMIVMREQGLSYERIGRGARCRRRPDGDWRQALVADDGATRRARSQSRAGRARLETAGVERLGRSSAASATRRGHEARLAGARMRKSAPRAVPLVVLKTVSNPASVTAVRDSRQTPRMGRCSGMTPDATSTNGGSMPHLVR